MDTLLRVDRELAGRDYRTHEFGDSVFVERATETDCPTQAKTPVPRGLRYIQPQEVPGVGVADVANHGAGQGVIAGDLARFHVLPKQVA